MSAKSFGFLFFHLLLTKSTGMKSAMLSSLHMIVWKIPFPTADTIPVGPFQLSTHPLSGSLMLDRTELGLKCYKNSGDFSRCNSPIEGRTIATGRLPASFSSMLSARAFVKVYVFGRLPISDGVNCKSFTNPITAPDTNDVGFHFYLVQ
jgi:hypothetical protein